MPLLIPIQKNVIKVEIVCHFREIWKKGFLQPSKAK